MLEGDRTDIRAERHKVTQEDFTPQSVVDDMLLKLPDDVFTDFSKTVLDPSCGIGNFLVEVLERRLKHCKKKEDAIMAVQTLYGVELMADNVEECRDRLYRLVLKKFHAISNSRALKCRLRMLIKNRIQWHDSLEFDYDHWTDMEDDCAGNPDKISFHEKPVNDFYPMWHKTEARQLELF